MSDDVSKSMDQFTFTRAHANKDDDEENPKQPNPARLTSGVTQCLAGSQNVRIGTLNVTSVGGHNYGAEQGETKEIPLGDVLKWIKGPNFKNVFKEALSQHTEGTGSWFVESDEFSAFTTEKGAILWATGMPGAGKTVIASVSIVHFEDTFSGRSDVAITYAFLRYSEQWIVRDVVAGLLSHLVATCDEVLNNLRSVYRRFDPTGEALTVQDMTTALQQLVDIFHRVFVVLDGLDEVSDTTKEGLLQALSPLGLNILITSRPLQLYHIPQAISVSILARTSDIEVFVAEQIEQLPRLRRILQGRKDLEVKIFTRIKEKSKGMFLLARLQLESLRGASSVNSVLRTLETLPSGLDGMYQLTLQRINSQSKDDVNIAHKVLTWLAHARETLSPREIQEVLAISSERLSYDPDDAVPLDLVTTACCGLVTVTEISKYPEPYLAPTHRLELIHYTTQDFLKAARLPGYENPHHELALSSLVYFETHMGEFRQRHGLALPPWLCYLHFPLWRYVEDNWVHHRALASQEGALHPHIASFFDRHTLLPISIKDDHSVPFVGNEVWLVGALHFAAYYGVSDVISMGTLPFSCAKGAKGYTPFHVAIIQDQLDAFDALLTAYEGVNVKSNSGETPLMLACRMKKASFLERLLLRRPPSPNPVQDLTREPTEVNAQDPKGLILAILARDELTVEIQGKVVDILLACKELDVNMQDSVGNTALMLACRYEDERMVRKLLSRQDHQLNLRDGKGRTAFFYACRSAGIHAALISLSPTSRMDIYAGDTRGVTAFMAACKFTVEPVVRWFLRLPRGGDLVRQTDSSGQTPLMHFLRYGADKCPGQRRGTVLAVLNLLIEYGSDIHARDHVEGRSAFLWAASARNRYPTPCSRMEDPEDLQRWHDSWLESSTDNVLLFGRLLSCDPSIDVNQRDARGKTALMLAATSNNPGAAFTFLLEREVPVNAQDEEGMTALMHCAWEGGYSGIDVLISHPDVDPRLRDIHGDSVLDRICHLDYRPRYNDLHLTEYATGIDMIRVLFGRCEWKKPMVRRMVLNTVLHNRLGYSLYLLGMPSVGSSRNVEEADNTVTWRVREAFGWILEDNDTVLLLVAALKQRNILVALEVLSRCGCGDLFQYELYVHYRAPTGIRLVAGSLNFPANTGLRFAV